ncbi:MAG TPA: NUDIX hydrolase [Opitutaceae bacterium]|nr:NUDIX hydrolase [Opitutaceae bacterium]HRJ47229.1 NUDIX hydrolase [Opitutaceae bacterium]
MNLAPVLSLLRAHAERKREAHEAEMTVETIRFVETHADCLLRSQLSGHLTGSAWVVDAARTRTLLTHHRKLDKWLQLGGHADGDPDLLAVALREAQEESGLTRLRPVGRALFDLDRHWIPEHRGVPAHWHFDLRFMIEADPAEPLVVTSESKDLAWVELGAVAGLNPEESMARMVRKTVGQGASA